ncbi:phosphoinositide 3-kinase regulatory subunit 5 [Oryzias latipes]|uniref:Phosphoinositide 3-kinase regulatory subunit 5 n=1 Tax=Oryzias latipes TaxID=8090 RepID=H2MKF5_ORYLA|nr:phosphoinositide 3-kinase regulatory subunit 5 [Oryzias latipes]
MFQQAMEQSSCTEDRIQHLLERCLYHLNLNSPDRHIWRAGLCISRWCLEELVKRDPHNFLIVLQKILRKTEEVLEQSHHELVVPLTLLFSSALLRIPYMPPECNMLQEAYRLFHRFLSWPEPCSSASKRLLSIIQQELRAPGISFQRMLRTEQDIPHDNTHSKSIVVLLLNPDEDIPPEVQLASEQLSKACSSPRDIAITLILHSFQAVLGAKHDLQAVHTALEEKPTEELQQLLKAITDRMETAASAGDHRTAREGLIQSMERISESLAAPAAGTDRTERDFETFEVTSPRCHMCLWEDESFDFLSGILASDYCPDCPVESFLKAAAADEEDHIDTSMDEEDELDSNTVEVQSYRISSASSSSRDSTLSSHSLSSSWSVPSASSGVESDCGDDPTPEDSDKPSQPEPRKKPKKKSKSLLGIERFALLFKTPISPSMTRRAQSMGFFDINKDSQRSGLQLNAQKSVTRPARSPHPPTPPTEPLSSQRNLCVRRRPILSCSEDSLSEVPTLVKVVMFGGDREVGRLARAYCDLQQKESRCPLLTKMCKLQFYFVPTKRRTDRHSETALSKPTGSVESDVPTGEEGSTDVCQMLGMMDPWYERNVVSLLSLSSEVLCQVAPKEDRVSRNKTERLALLADMVLYYCRHAEQPLLMQLYQVELTLAGGERRREVFIHSLELGHTAGTRALKSMGAAGKRFGIDEEREAVPLTLSVTYNKVAMSRRTQRVHREVVCTSINLYKTCQEADLLDLKDGLHMTMTEVLKRQCSKSKKSFNQLILISKAKVVNVQVIAGNDGTTFTVCLDQDEKKFIQGVTRCEVSLCCKSGAGSDWTSYKPFPGQVQPVEPTYCSLLCLPITCFSASCP